MELLVKLLTPTAKCPTKAHESDAGYDLYSDQDVVIRPGETVIVNTGVAVTPKDSARFTGLIWDRSSMGAKGIHRLAGVIDNTYTGPLKIVLTNLNVYPMLEKIFSMGPEWINPSILNDYGYTIKKGDKIAQILFQEVGTGPTVLVEDLSGERGEKGFGSSGT